MATVDHVADAEGMFSEINSASDSFIFRLEQCFALYPDFLTNVEIEAKVIAALQKAESYIVDASIHVQLSFLNRKVDPVQYAKSFEIAPQGDDFDDIRAEYTAILQKQLASGNNGMQTRDPELLQTAIRQEQRSREPARLGDFKEHLAALHTGLIEAEAQRIAADMKRLAAPNSPDKNHFMVEVSPYFTKLASSRDTDQLLAMLPYKSLHLSSVKDHFGIYALVNKNENRDRGIRKPRASVRKQLSETKQAASPKKAAARSKQHEMEV